MQEICEGEVEPAKQMLPDGHNPVTLLKPSVAQNDLWKQTKREQRENKVLEKKHEVDKK